MGYFDDLKKTRKPETTGFIWMHVLVKYDYTTGKSEIVKSFTNPAKDSEIKRNVKEKVIKPVKQKIEFEATDDKKQPTSLF